jgi:hypothetical protein
MENVCQVMKTLTTEEYSNMCEKEKAKWHVEDQYIIIHQVLVCEISGQLYHKCESIICSKLCSHKTRYKDQNVEYLLLCKIEDFTVP